MDNMFTLHRLGLGSLHLIFVQESECESASGNVNEPLITGGRSHQKKAKMVAIRLKLSLYVPSSSPFAVSGTCDLLNIVCEQHHITTLNPFLNDTKKNGEQKV